MKYCLFCRDSFEDEMKTCPYCGDRLLDELPDADLDEEDSADGGEGTPAGEESADQGELVQVAILTREEHLRAAVEILKEAGIYFEIEETDRKMAQAGIIPERAWRILVEGDSGHDAFLLLVDGIPEAFPPPVADASGAASCDDEPSPEALARVDALLAAVDSPGGAKELAWPVIELFSSEDGPGIARAKAIMARHGAVFAALLADIAVEAAASGGEAAERILFHSLQVLEAVGFEEALERIEDLYASPTAQVRTRAAYAAGRLGAPQAVERLLELMADEDEEVRYEASESVWRLTGLDFEFEPDAPVEEERENIERLRETWRKAKTTARVRDRVTLTELFRSLEED